YSFRNGKTTLFGGDPVICLTEMPLNSFLKYASSRRKDSIDTYGIAITKKAAFKYGARPVIYGLSHSNFSYIENTQTKRILPDDILPIQEQYRLVSHNLDEKRIDWTHEREWRIKKKGLDKYITSVEYGMELPELEILNIFEEESYCEEVILIVQTSEEADELFDIVVTLKDSGSNNYSNEFLPNKVSIVVVDNIKKEDIDAVKIDNISKECYFEVQIEELSQTEKDLLNKTLKIAKGDISIAAETEFHKTTSLSLNEHGHYNDLCGFASIMCFSPRNKYLREMLNLGIASSYGEGYIIKAIGNVNKYQSVTYHEFIADKVCKFLNEKLDNVFSTKTYLD
ncbi:MAG: hypothetical protein AB3N10_19035, partial [Allomuricauda sp.]